jgi:hypothetical protein
LRYVHGDVYNTCVHLGFEIAAVVHVREESDVDGNRLFLQEKSDAVVHLLAADVDVVAKTVELRGEFVLGAFEFLKAETGGTLTENKMEEVR